MKIGIDARFLTHPQVGGFKTYTENLVTALSQVDHLNSYIIYLDRPPLEDTLPQNDNFTYQVVEGTLPVVGLPFREQITLRRRIAGDKVDLIHFLCNTAPVKVSGKFVVTLHDTIQVTNSYTFHHRRSLSNHKQWAMGLYSKWTILKSARAARKVITVSNYEKTQITKHLGITPQRICVTHLAPNPVFTPVSPEVKAAWRAKMRQKLGLPDRFILGVGYEVRKNIPLLIEAFSRIASDQSDLGLVIVAAQDERRLFFEKLVAELNLSQRVVILASLPACDLAGLYNLADVFVFPSERESFGLPPLEAMACGAPVIAMDLSSIPEIVQDGALLIHGKEVQTWADAISRVVTDETLRSGLVQRGLQQAATLNWRRCAQETIQVYRAVLEAK